MAPKLFIPFRKPSRRVVGVAVVAPLLGAVLTACGGSETGDTTCGTYLGYSKVEKRDFLKKAAKEDGVVDEETAKTIEGATDEELDLAASFLQSACEGADASTTMNELE